MLSVAVDAFWRTLAGHGQRLALDDGRMRLNYTAMLAEVERRSGILQRENVCRAALALDNGLEWVLWDLALLRAGVIGVPLPGFFSVSQKHHILNSAGVDCLIGDSEEIFDGCGFLPSRHDLLRRPPTKIPTVPPATQKITYTSGTTGQPKGVCLSAETQLIVARSIQQACASSCIERHLCVLPLATLLENLAGVYAQLLGGACIELRPLALIGLQGASGFALPIFLEVLRQSQPHSLILLPQLLLGLVNGAERGLQLPSSLRFIAVGGGRVAPQLLERADALGLPVFEGYGLSECASVVCLNTPQARRIGSVGRPLPHVQLRLGADSEILIRGPHLLGYLGEVKHDEEWLASGDLGYLEDGFLVLHGRKKNQFVTAYGRNVNPEWVEAELVQQKAIAQAWLHGEAQAENVAVLVPRGPAYYQEEIAAAIAEVNRNLPDYARVHRWLLAEHPFTASNGLVTVNGRLCRAALFQHYSVAIAAALQGFAEKTT